MYTVKAFATHASLINNTAGVVSPIGEISQLALTYAREVGRYFGSAAPGATILTFTAKNGSSQVVLSQTISDHISAIVGGLFNKSFTSGALTTQQILTYLTANFGSAASTFQCGPMVDNGTFYMPAWVSWVNTSISALTSGGNLIKIWFADTNFKSEYDDFQIVVIPPTTTLNSFFGTPSSVQAMLAAITPTQSMSLVEAAKAGFPETALKALAFDYINPSNTAQRFTANWYVLIYGAAGNNPDSIKDALIAHALANSTHDQPAWITIIPDLFRRTEFVMVPLWDQYAIPNQEVEAGIYSPVANAARAIALLKTYANTYAGSHVDAHAHVMAHPYQSLQIWVVGSPDNRDSLFELNQVFKDILAVSTSSLDFSRMRVATQEFLNKLAEMLPVAEAMDQYSSIPVGYSRVTRNNKLYIVVSLNNINYLVLAKKNMPTVITGT